MFKRYFLLAATTIFLINTTYANELNLNPHIGTIVAAKGKILRNNTTIYISEKVYESDVLSTENKSFMTIEFTDGTHITLRPLSKIKIDEYFFSGSNSDVLEFSLLNGGLRMITGAISKQSPDNVKLGTPVAILGVRGSEFGVILCEGTLCEVEVK